MIETTYHGYRRLDFTFEGREAILVFPLRANEKKNWLLKTEYFEAFPDFELEMVKNGWHLAYVSNKTRWCLDEDLDIKERFCQYLCDTFGLYSRCVPVGMSCGGMIGTKFAARYPNRVSALYLDAPVMNLLSCPAGIGVAGDSMLPEFLAATGMTMSDLIAYREHPIDKIPSLFENGISVIMVYGDADDVVPYSENGAHLERYYREHGGEIECYAKVGCAHHPHGLDDVSAIVDFVLKHRN